VRGSALVVALLVSGVASAHAGGNPHVHRLLDSFAKNCGVSTVEYRKEVPAFTRKNHSGEWQGITRAELGNCWECFEKAFVWNGREGRHVVQIESDSESRDWYQYVLYCYGPDGKLAGALFDLNTAWGWAVVSRFAMRQGKVSEGPLEFRDTRTWQRTPSMPDGADQMYASGKPVMYSTLRELPFYVLLKEKQ